MTNTGTSSPTKSTAAGGSFHTKAHTPSAQAEAQAKATALVSAVVANTTRVGRHGMTAEEYRASYKVMHIGVGIPNSPRHGTYERLSKLAGELRVNESDLVWEGITRVLDNPPKELAASSRGARGVSAGYWIVPVTDETGRAQSFQVVEVSQRSELTSTGTQFFKFMPGDVKGKARARRNAIIKANKDTILAGLGKTTVEVVEFDDTEDDTAAVGDVDADDATAILNEGENGPEDEDGGEDSDIDSDA